MPALQAGKKGGAVAYPAMGYSGIRRKPHRLDLSPFTLSRDIPAGFTRSMFCRHDEKK